MVVSAAAHLASDAVRLERVPLGCRPSVREALRAVRDEPGAFALTGAWAGGGAIVGSRPVLVAGEAADPFAVVDALPPVDWDDAGEAGTLCADALRRGALGDGSAGAVGGGWFGWFGYRLGRRIERLPDGPVRPVPVPEFGLAYYDHLLRLDPAGQWWFEALVREDRVPALRARHTELVDRLSGSATERAGFRGPPPLRLSTGAADHHLDAVCECRERIAAGEIYQANICLRLETEWDGDIAALFGRAVERIAPSYAALFAAPWGGIASLSPELFLRRRGREVITAPIKGTIGRDGEPARAAAALAKLRASAKDASEHVMIVDLMRNDLGRVCAYGTVHAPDRPDAEPHPGLWHLVSRVRGELRRDAGDGDLLRATFPPGSVTGAPKVQAMRVIAELEPTGREVYTGAIGYVSPVAGLELSVAIRTLELSHGRLWLGAGGGIVADSEPRRELEEALVKARPIAAAVGTSVTVDGRAPTAARGDGRGRRASGDADARAGEDAAAPDPALGVFETLLVRDARVQALGLHLDRLSRSVADLYGEHLPADLADAVRSAADGLGGAHRLRISAVPGPRGVAPAIGAERLSLPDPSRPLVLAPLPIRGGLGAHKWCDRQLLDRHSTGATVPLIIDGDEEILEAAWANVWIVEGRRIVTPPADGRLLAGVTRDLLLSVAGSLGLEAVSEPISPVRARRADGIFLTSSLRHAVSARLATRATDPSGDGAGSGDDRAELVATIRCALSQASWEA